MEKNISGQFLQATDTQSLKRLLEEICSQYRPIKPPDVFLDPHAGEWRATCLVVLGYDDIQRAARDFGGTVFAVNRLLFSVDLPHTFKVL